MPCSGYILFAAEQGEGYQTSWVDLQREKKLSVKSVGLPIEFANFNLPCRLHKRKY